MQWRAGVFNGAGPNSSDNDRTKDVVAQAMRPLAGFDCSASVYLGKEAEINKSLFGFSAGRDFRFARLQGEFVFGSFMGNDVSGYYLQAARPLDDRRLLGLRADTYDSGLDTTTTVGFGYLMQLDPATRLRAWYDSVEGAHNDRLYLEAQVVY
jgi:hypothetical protein